MELAIGFAQDKEGGNTSCYSEELKRVEFGKWEASKSSGRCKSESKLSALE